MIYLVDDDGSDRFAPLFLKKKRTDGTSTCLQSWSGNLIRVGNDAPSRSSLLVSLSLFSL